ncbi:MAG TPA: LPS assembly lipoprotein LptE [Rhodocyclaceae bacterium]|nr:LPS assembly lipoprotein LptE [Rhodocyclaceae bacterium]
MPRALILVLCLSLGLSACGFRLRGSWQLPYESLFLDIPAQSEFGAQLKRTLRGSQATRIAERAEDAEAVFKPTGETRERKVITYSSGGRVREVQLIYSYSFRIVDRKGADLIAPEAITMTRDMSYDEANALAKSAEEDLIWRDMMNDLTQQIMRRLAGTTRSKVLGSETGPAPVSAGSVPVAAPAKP